MKPEIRREVEDLFHQALQLRPEERKTFLQKHCSNNESLRQEVESLLGEYDDARSFLERPPIPSRALRDRLETETASELHIGAQIGAYEIVELIGAGGMGQVYRARDTRLKRDVAIKVLPEAFAHDADRLSRFRREAKILASLNHSNIATIHGLEQNDSMSYLVMEMVTGETLQERIERDGAIPIDEALAIAKQIAEALEAAHEKGVVHRDLKPANIKTTPDGKVKVLDFGLAKAMESGVSNTSLSNSPTLSMATDTGVILGTAAYMSPEQVQGKETDRRTDIFAFGCVLYEMLTGRRAFAGETMAQILARVIEREPDWNALPANTPARLHELVRRCLIKEPRRRLRDIGDAWIVMEEARSRSELDHQVLPVATRGRARIAWSLVGLLTLTAVMLGVRVFRPLPQAPPAHETRLDIVTPATSDPISFALSPDGRQIVFAAVADGLQRLWLRPLDKTTAQPLAGTEGASYPFWSPDSRSIGFFTGINLRRIDLAGGSPQELGNIGTGAGGTWSENGVMLLGGGPLYRIPASGGEALVVTKLDKGQTNHRFPQFLPGGRQFLFYATGTAETQGVYLGSLDAPEAKRLTAADSFGVYTPQGWLLFIRAGTLLAQRLDLARQELADDPVTVADPVAFGGTVGGAAAVSVSATGVLAYRTGGTAGRRQLAWFDRSGKALGTLGAADENNLLSPRLSPDGRRVAVYRTVQGNSDVWILDGDRTTRFTFDASQDRDPVWSPDGSRIVFTSNRKGVANLYQKLSSGAGSEALLVESAQDKYASDWSGDGRFLTYISNGGQTSWDLWALSLEGDRKPLVFLKTSFNERRGAFSPDGHWMAYMSTESGREEIYVRPFPEPGGQWQVSTAGGISPRWAPAGKELYYIAPDGILMAAPFAVKGTAIEPGRPVALFHTRILGGGTEHAIGTQYDIARDGRFLINTILEDTSSSSPITLLQNWKPPAK